MRSFPVLTLLALLAGGGNTVRAQSGAPSTGFGLGAISIPGTEKDRNRTTGLRFGRSVFHAGLTLEAGWDSNVFYRGSDEISSAYLRLLPTLYLGTNQMGDKIPSTVYNIDLTLDYLAYLQELNAAGRSQHHVGLSLGAGVNFNTRGILRFGLVEQFVRTTEPHPGLDSLARDYNQVGFDLSYHPGGSLLTVLLRYRLILDYFEQSQYSFASSLRNDIRLRASWRFFPKTSWWLEVQTGHVWFWESFSLADLGTPAAGNRDVVPLAIVLGATGRLTPKLTLDVGVGYRAYFYTENITDEAAAELESTGGVGDDFHGATAHVGLGWAIAPTVNLKLGFRHDEQVSVVGDQFQSESAYMSLNMLFFQRLELRMAAAWTLAMFKGYYVTDYADLPGGCQEVDLPGLSNTVNSCPRQDNYLLISVDAQYYFLRWLSAGIGYQLLGNESNFKGTYIGSPVRPTFWKHRVFGQVTAYY